MDSGGRQLSKVTDHPSDGCVDDDDVVEHPTETSSEVADQSGNQRIESKDAYDQDRLDRLDERDIFDAMQFETELKNTFGLNWIDDELREPLEIALDRFHSMHEEGRATAPGMFATALKVFLQGHLRGFGRYYSGSDPWPRPSEIVQAEIDERMPRGLDWLRVELDEALEHEGRIPPVRSSDEGEGQHCWVRIREESRTGKRTSGDQPDRLELLAESFRRRINFGVPLKADSTGHCESVVSFERLPGGRPAKAYLRFVAVDPETYRGDAVFDRASKQAFWEGQTNVRAVPPQFLKAGLAIWRKLDISLSAERVKAMMQMKDIDDGTSEAVQAALFNTFNTSMRPVDIESIAFALASFIHADQLRKHLVSDEAFDEPYGDRTVYGLWDPFDPDED